MFRVILLTVCLAVLASTAQGSPLMSRVGGNNLVSSVRQLCAQAKQACVGFFARGPFSSLDKRVESLLQATETNIKKLAEKDTPAVSDTFNRLTDVIQKSVRLVENPQVASNIANNLAAMTLETGQFVDEIYNNKRAEISAKREELLAEEEDLSLQQADFRRGFNEIGDNLTGGELSSQRNQISKLESALESRSELESALKNQISKLKSALESRSELESALKNQNSELKSALKEVREESEQARKDALASADEIDDRNGKLIDENSELKSEIEKLRGESEQALKNAEEQGELLKKLNTATVYDFLNGTLPSTYVLFSELMQELNTSTVPELADKLSKFITEINNKKYDTPVSTFFVSLCAARRGRREEV